MEHRNKHINVTHNQFHWFGGFIRLAQFSIQNEHIRFFCQQKMIDKTIQGQRDICLFSDQKAQEVRTKIPGKNEIFIHEVFNSFSVWTIPDGVGWE